MGIRWVQVLGLILLVLLVTPAAAMDYGGALSKSLLYFEAQMSGQLPTGHRVAWRGNSGLQDGREQNVSLFFRFSSLSMLEWNFFGFSLHLR